MYVTHINYEEMLMSVTIITNGNYVSQHEPLIQEHPPPSMKLQDQVFSF